jgi:hypothetical protein
MSTPSTYATPVDTPSRLPSRFYSHPPPNLSIGRPNAVPSGQSKVGVGVAMSAKMVMERQLEWQTQVDAPLLKLVQFFTDKCAICYIDGNREYRYHSSCVCSSRALARSSDAYHHFRTVFSKPDKMCFGCGLHTGMSIFNFISNDPPQKWSQHRGPVGKACVASSTVSSTSYTSKNKYLSFLFQIWTSSIPLKRL